MRRSQRRRLLWGSAALLVLGLALAAVLIVRHAEEARPPSEEQWRAYERCIDDVTPPSTTSDGIPSRISLDVDAYERGRSTTTVKSAQRLKLEACARFLAH